MTELHLAWNKLGAEGGRAVADAIKVNTSLTWLNLVANELDAHTLSAIEDALQANKTNQFQQLGDSQVQRAEEEAVKSLESLRSRRLAPSHS